jgi:two-component system phosphate regulon sensor histidine kinase PhoR
MQQLIQDLLTLSALETGAPMWQEEPVDVAKLVHDVEREAIVVSGGRHRIELDCSVSAPLLGNAKELHSAFANLAINAVRYTPEAATSASAGGSGARWWNTRWKTTASASPPSTSRA